MDAELSLVMANMGLVRAGTVCLDPYVGTGSLLVACSQFGAFCMGSDIDHRVLRGKGEGRTMRDNFEQYSLPVPEIIRCDLSPVGAAGLRMWAPRRVDGRDGAAESSRTPPAPLVDSIVCDPPYGIRAGARKSGSRRAHVHAVPAGPFFISFVCSFLLLIYSFLYSLPVPAEFIETHIPQTQPYAAAEVMRDLLELAARTLVLGGRLVYLIPVDRPSYDVALLPAHRCLSFVANSEQGLTRTFSRRLITMEKTRTYASSDLAAFEAKLAAGGDVVAAASFYSDVSSKIGRQAAAS